MANNRSRSFQAALKALVGYQSKDGDNARATLVYPKSPTALTAAATVTIPAEGMLFTVTGSTGLANLAVEGGDILPGRIVVLRGIAGANSAVTDTALSGTAQNKIHTAGSRTIGVGATLILEQQANGSWYEIGFTAALG